MGHSCVWRCDRCGTTSEPQPGSSMPEGWAELALINDGEEPRDPFEADLCPTCVQAARAFLTDID